LLTEQNAAWLSNNDLKGFVFTLPNVEEWLDFLGDGKDRKLTYYNTNRTGHVGLMGANSNGLNDVNGNVRQWLLNGDLAGASYNSKIAWAGIGHIPGGNEATKEKEDGFRIILKAVR
jgi:formylglycine-generating enzyme required for sulfatase activity